MNEEHGARQVTKTELRAHLKRMRVLTGVFLGSVPVAIVLSWFLPRQASSVGSPMTITLVAVAASLWIGFSANRDAGNRLERIKRAFAVHGDEVLLLRGHLTTYLMVLVRLEVMVLSGLVAAVWGAGPRLSVWIILLAGVMIGLTWPTERKTQLLLGRARVLRETG